MPLLQLSDAIGNPFGPFAVGREGTRAAGSRAASNYSDGEIVGFDLIATYATDLYRHEADGWRLVHRHADPIVEIRSAESVAGS